MSVLSSTCGVVEFVGASASGILALGVLIGTLSRRKRCVCNNYALTSVLFSAEIQNNNNNNKQCTDGVGRPFPALQVVLSIGLIIVVANQKRNLR